MLTAKYGQAQNLRSRLNTITHYDAAPNPSYALKLKLGRFN